jgi:anti-anti-sigma regulatory factor
MLRITWAAGSDAAQVLKLEGKLLDPWVSEVRDAWVQAAARSARVSLDLSAVSFVDAAGAQLLRELLGQGVTIAACSSFVAELLHLEHAEGGTR